MNLLSEAELDLLDQYIRGELNPEEDKRIAERVRSEDAWRSAHELRIAAREAARNIFHSEMRMEFKRLDSERPGTFVRPVWLALAAGVALLISALLWFLPDTSSDNLMASYAKFPNIVMPIEKSGGEFSIRERAYQAYELNDYSQAVAYFTSLANLNTTDSLFLGLSLLESGQSAEAEKLFVPLEGTTEVRWAQVAQWYRMWALIRSGKSGEARALLKLIRNTPGHRYHEQALTLLKNF